MHVITEEPFIVKPNNDAKELVWVHDVGYSYRLPDGSLVPTCKSISEMIEREAPAPDGCPDQGARVIPVRGLHDKLPVLGFRFGDIAYITDMSSLEESELEAQGAQTSDSQHGELQETPFSLQSGRGPGPRRQNRSGTHLADSSFTHFPESSRICEISGEGVQSQGAAFGCAARLRRSGHRIGGSVSARRHDALVDQFPKDVQIVGRESGGRI